MFEDLAGHISFETAHDLCGVESFGSTSGYIATGISQIVDWVHLLGSRLLQMSVRGDWMRGFKRGLWWLLNEREVVKWPTQQS